MNYLYRDGGIKMLFIKLWGLSIAFSVGLNITMLFSIIIKSIKEGKKITRNTFKIAKNLLNIKSLKRALVIDLVPILNVLVTMASYSLYVESYTQLKDEMRCFKETYGNIKTGQFNSSLNIELIKIKLGESFPLPRGIHRLSYVLDGKPGIIWYELCDGFPCLHEYTTLKDENDKFIKAAVLRESLKRVAIYLNGKSSTELQSLLANSLEIVLPMEKEGQDDNNLIQSGDSVPMGLEELHPLRCELKDESPTKGKAKTRVRRR